MKNANHVEANSTQIYQKFGSETVSDTRGNNREPGKRFSKGYAAVRKIVANNVGDQAADKVMKRVLKNDTTRRDGWATFWNPRKSAITRKQLGQIITEAYKEVNSQMLRVDNVERDKLLAELSGEDGKPLELHEVLKNPELSKLLRAQAIADNNVGHLNLLRDCEDLDKLAEEARGLQVDLNVAGIKDENGKTVHFDERGKPQPANGGKLGRWTLAKSQKQILQNYQKVLR
ncbi:MAG: hypothetical protein MI861_22725, partial [Pirellulales bacterium]|nr:hypothetical protein [Pirellulales bacterium]